MGMINTICSQSNRQRWYLIKTVTTMAKTARLPFSSLPSASPQPLVKTEFTDDGIALIRMNSKPANTLSMEMRVELTNAIKNISTEHPATSAMVLSSSLTNNIFCAGIDISRELYKPDSDRLPKFWHSFQELFLQLYGCGTSSISTIAAITGHAPAGGCMVALSSDYRIMTSEQSKIGYNESALGIVAPPWMCQRTFNLSNIWR